MLSDNHMHSYFSGDSEAAPEDMIKSSKDKGLSGITFTDHLDWDYHHEPGLFDLDIPKYLSKMRQIAETCATDAFPVRVGIELGLQPHLADRHTYLLKENNFDYVIGSVHQIDGNDPYYDTFFEGRSIVVAYRDYLLCLLENLSEFYEIDALGHLDYISRYGMRVAKSRGVDGRFYYDDHREIIDEILRFLVLHDIALEVNTGAFRYGYDEPNPSYEIIRRYREMGGCMLTLGADAHKPEDVGGAFEKVIPRLKELGFSSYYVFTKRKPTEKPFD